MKSYIRLDFIRGIAALMVLIGHLRALIFNDYNPHSLSVAGKVFYFLTGFGHQAVVIFFVLSGFFITKSIYDSLQKNRWSLKIYSIHRLSRLWLVLIPGLFLALALDQFGLQHFNHPAYYGQTTWLPAVNPSTQISLNTFLGNVFFLQDIAVPTFGSDAALWSLANEFWYYCFLPLLIVPFFTIKKNNVTIVVCLLALIGLNILLFQLFAGFVIFLMGGGCYLIFRKLKSLSRPGLRLLSLLLFLTALLITRLQYFSPTVNDLMLGFAFSNLILCWLHAKESSNKLFINVSGFLSGFSYTVYVVHLPVALFCCGIFHLYNKQFSISMLGIYTGLILGILLFARLFYWLFERNTTMLRRWLERKLVFEKKIIPSHTISLANLSEKGS